LLDEPTSGLDPAAADEFAQLLERLRQDGAAILMTTHDLFRAKASGTRVGIMIGGRLLSTLATSGVDDRGLERIYLNHARQGSTAS
jgi:ABC-2 type transport system ATP-binding protein